MRRDLEAKKCLESSCNLMKICIAGLETSKASVWRGNLGSYPGSSFDLTRSLCFTVRVWEFFKLF